MNKIKRVLITLLLLLPVALFTSCSNDEEATDIITSYYAVNEFTEELVKNTDITVKCLITGSVEPHDFEPTAKQIASMVDAKMVVLNGLDMEEYAETLSENNSIKDKIIYASANNTAITDEDGDTDPHTFVCVKEALTMVSTIKDALISTFSSYEDTILANYETLYASLESLDTKFCTLFSSYTNTLIVGHNAFSYLTRDYGVKTKAILGMHEEEPSAKTIAEIEDYITSNNISVIYGEYFEENEAIETIANDCNVEVKYLYTCEMMDDSNLSYLECQQANLNTLK